MGDGPVDRGRGDERAVGSAGRRRVLLVDNHDSYTWNLHQLIWQVSGEEPRTAANDALDPAEVLQGGYTHLVISPGPGTPMKQSDVGKVPELLASFPGPVLGVCLGHQVLAAGFGAEVRRAPEVMHGRVDDVTHDGTGIFAGIPQKFRCVRYHSLAVPEPLPEELEVTARASDGVVMGLRHRARPLHGVQFHPESVETEYGRELITNFLAFAPAPSPSRGTVHREAEHGEAAGSPLPNRGADPDRPRPWDGIPAPTGGLGPQMHGRSGADAHTRAQARPPAAVHTRSVTLAVSLEDVFGTLHADEPHAFWLDSARTAYGMGRYSFLGSVDTERDPLLRYAAGPDGAGLEEVRGGAARPIPGGLYDELRRRIDADRVDPRAAPLPFLGGLVGYLGYGAARGVGADGAGAGPVRPDPRGPDAAFLTVRRFLAADHRTGRTRLVQAGGTAADAASWFDEYEARLRTVVPLPAPRPAAAAPAPARAGVGRDRYLGDLGRVRERLLDGESYEACYTYGVDVPALESPAALFDAYRRLRRGNPAPYAAYLRTGPRTLLSASPERFLSVDADGRAASKPIKGTAPRHADPALDDEEARRLSADVKTRGENLMIADLIRNDLGRVCRPGSVQVPRLMDVESYATVHQLVTSVQGGLLPACDAVDALRALFPGGSMTGAPKERTVALLDALEAEPRGPYAGCLGYLGFNGTADLNIIIRTLVHDPDGARLGTGGAIVALSDPEEEYRETRLKAAAVLAAVGAELPAAPDHSPVRRREASPSAHSDEAI